MMKKNYFNLVLAFFIAFVSYAQTPIITNVVDGTCGSSLKFVEIYVSGTIDFSDYKFVRRSNDGTWDDNGVDIDISALGSRTDEFVYLIRDLAALNSEFPTVNISGDNSITSGSITHNGDDSYRIVQIDGDVVIDQFGGDEDGTGLNWEYTDSWATRNDSEGPNSTFTESEWNFRALDALEDVGLCNGATEPLESIVNNLATYTPPATGSGPDVASPTPPQEQEDVISIFSEQYTGNTSFTATTFGVPGNNSTGEFETFASNEVFKVTYDGGDFIGLEFDEAIDASAMENFHIDVWIENPVPVGAVSIYKWSNHGGGHLTGETDSFTSTQIISEGQNGQWLSFDIPLNAEGFPGQTGEGTDARSILSQLVINSASADGTYGPFYFDNLYFWKEPSAASDCSATGTFEYENNSDITNSLNSFVADNPGDYITLTFTAGSTEPCCDTWFINDSADGTGNTIASGNGSIVGSYESTTGEISFYVESDFSVTGEAFEYELSCSPPPSCPAPAGIVVDNVTGSSADLAWTPGGSETEWQVLWGEEGFDPETEGTLEDNLDVPSITLSDLSPTTPYDAYVRAVCSDTDDSEWVLVNFTTSIASVVVSVDSPESVTYCYDNNVFEEWLFESSNGSPLVIDFSQGSVEVNVFGGNTFDDLIIYDGQDDSGEILFNSDEDIVSAADLTDLTLTAESGFMYITLESDGSISCVDPGFGEEQTEIQFEVSVFEPEVANVQIIHNSPDPAASSVDIYLDSVLIPELTGVNFRESTGFLEVPASVDVVVDIVPAGADISESVFTETYNLADDENYIIVANGVLDPGGFVTDNEFELTVYAGANTVADDPAGVDVLVHHGSPDAPPVDVNEPDAGNLVSNIAYPEFQGYLPLPVADYVLEIAAAGTPDALVAYQAPLASLGGFEGAAITIVASGFFGDDAGENNGFGLWVATAAAGPLLELPLVDDSAYCTPVEFPNGCADDNIDSFEIPGAEFSHLDTGCSDGTYGDFTGEPSLEINLSKTVVYDFSITHNWNAQVVKMWVDYNQDNVFDESEVLFVSEAPSGGTSGNPDPTLGSFAIPSSVDEGTTRLRVITRFNNEPLDPCDPTDGAASAWGEVHDYTVNILPQPSCAQPVDLTADVSFDSADLSWTPDGDETEWEVLWGEAGFDPETEGTLEDNLDVPSVTLSPLSSETPYDAYVRAVCSDTEVSAWSFINFTTPIAPVIVNSGVTESEAYCYDNNDFKEWLFVSFDGSPLVIEFLQGNVETFFDNSGSFDDLIIYDGQDDTGVVLFNSDEDAVTANDLTGLTLTAESGSMYITLETDFSVSCADDPEILEILFEVSLQTVGTSQFDSNNFGFYPNPAENQLNFETISQVEEVRIYNIQGQQVMLETLNVVSPKLNVESLQTGTYIMSVTIDGASKNFKLIKK